MTPLERIHFSGGDQISFESERDSVLEHIAGVLIEALDDHDEPGEVSVVLVDDAEISRVHRDFMDDDTPTDVITFPLDPDGEPDFVDAPSDDMVSEQPGRLVGELVVSFETAAREALSRSIALERELCLYALHGVLHLLGYDDIADDDRESMREAEAKYMKSCRF